MRSPRRRSRQPLFSESISNRADLTVLPRTGSPFASSVFSDFDFKQRTDKPVDFIASPRFEMLSPFLRCPALKRKRRKNMLRALVFPECPDFPE